MKKIFPFFLLALLFGCCFWRVQTLAPETPLSLRSIFLVSAKPTIVLNEVKEEKNVFTDGKNLYTYRNSIYKYRSCNIGWDYHIKTLSGECMALEKDELITEKEAKAIWIKIIPKERRFQMPNYVYKPTPTDFLIDFDWTKIFLSDITENTSENFSTKYIDIILYRISLTKDLSKSFLVEIDKWDFILTKLKPNYQELIEQHKKNMKDYQNYLKQWEKTHINPKDKQDKKVEKAYNYVVSKYSYNYKYLENKESHYQGMNAIKTMQDNTWVCWGFAGAMVYMLNAQWLESRKINGLACTSEACENHSWVAVKYWDKWKYFDPTFEQWSQEANWKWNTPYFFWKLSKKMIDINHFPWKFKEVEWVKENDYLLKTNLKTEMYVKNNQKALLKKLSEKDKISSYPELYLWNKLNKNIK